MKKITFLMICLMATFFASAQITSMAIVGDGAGGWPPENQTEPDPNQMTSTDGIIWTYDNLIVTLGSVKFRANNTWNPIQNWGGTTFPNGTGVVDGPSIGTTAGVYDVTFNINTLEYTFVSQFPIISLIGPGTSGVPEDWDTDIDLGTADGVQYAKVGVALSGGVKFRTNHQWPADGNWEPPTFPSGTAILNGSEALDIPTGFYKVAFNVETLAYAFEYPTVALVGNATPQGWPVDPQVDQHVLTTTDGITYVLNSITLIDGGAKFRQENNWAVQWGGAFPEGGSQGGNDISVVAGTYSVTLNRTTGTYVFGAPIAGTETFEMASFKVYPNPTQNTWNFVSADETISNIVIVDMLGKTVLSTTGANTIDASGLSKGVYMAKVATDKGTTTVKLVKN